MRNLALAGGILCASACAAVTPLQGQAGEDQRTVLAVIAHPDDELVMAPALAQLTRNGSRVILIFATSGDAGPGVSGMENGAELALLREQEATCSAQALGATPVYLRFGDGTLATAAGRTDSVAAKLRTSLRDEIERLQPQLVMTWGPDGGYGHADHRMVSALITEVLQEMDGDLRPDLHYVGLVRGRMPEATPFGRWASTEASLLTVRYAYDDVDLMQADTATQCHKSQFDEATRAGLMPFFDQTVWQGEVGFRKAF